MTGPASKSRNPAESLSELLEVAGRSSRSATSRAEGIVPHGIGQRPVQLTGQDASMPNSNRTEVSRDLRVRSRPAMSHELEGSGPTEASSFTQGFASRYAKFGHARFGHASHFRTIETNTMEGLHNSGFDMGRQSKGPHSVHGLLKGADSFPLHGASPTGPLGIHPQITGSDSDGWQKAGTPGLLELEFGVSAIADDHRFLRVHLHVGLLERFQNTLIAITQVVGKVRSGSDQDH
eukprot:2640322-Amphidinium_carterae.1